MADHQWHTDAPEGIVAKNRCIYCGGPILVGEQYVQQEGFYMTATRSSVQRAPWR